MANTPYVTYFNAVGIAVAWLGAAFGPLFLAVGFGASSWQHMVIGIGLLLFVIAAIREGIQARRRGLRSTYVASGIVPLILLPAGIVLAYFSSPTVADSCLDSGGSFNYESCECDYSNNRGQTRMALS